MSPETIKAIRYGCKNSTKSYAEIAEEYGVDKKTVTAIHLGKIK